jgi:CO/xanthine dehydrogenase FAD-binding subunit
MHEPSPGLPEFDYLKPTSLTEASQLLAHHAGEARPLLGGTDTFVRMRDGPGRTNTSSMSNNLKAWHDITFRSSEKAYASARPFP